MRPTMTDKMIDVQEIEARARQLRGEAIADSVRAAARAIRGALGTHAPKGGRPA